MLLLMIKENYERDKLNYKDIKIPSGRIMSVRDMGKATFAVIQDKYRSYTNFAFAVMIGIRPKMTKCCMYYLEKIN